jgi:hypothetical protein
MLIQSRVGRIEQQSKAGIGLDITFFPQAMSEFALSLATLIGHIVPFLEIQ